VQRRVVVTGLGLVTPLGTGVEKTWEGLKAGKSGISTISRFDASSFKTQIAGEVHDFDPEEWVPKKKIRRLDPFIHFAIAGARMAWEMAGLPDTLDDETANRAGCILGVGLGGLITLEETIRMTERQGFKRVSPFFIPKLIGNMAPGEVSMIHNLRGTNLCVCTACAAGTHAVGEAMKNIQHGVTDLMVCGGAEVVCTATTLAGFGAARALSTRNDEPARASRPFDAERDGFIMSEGSGVLVLEELESAKARGAAILAELVGYGLTSDAYHMTAPDPSAQGFLRCMQMAVEDAGLRPDEVDYINAHGTSTDLNDLTETKAIKLLFGDYAKKLAISSTKSMLGHMLGATGGVEAVASVLTLRDQIMPPTINYENPDPECDLDYVPNQAREGKINTVLSNSFGFGGTNASILFRVYKP